ncbi:hypothetical protein ACI3KX_22035, partial [Microbacterium sp. ZW CA_36]
AQAGAARRDADRIPAAMLALAAARSLAAGRSIGSVDALYLRAPDVTLPHAPKRVNVAASAERSGDRAASQRQRDDA